MIYLNINIRFPGWWDRFKVIKLWHGKTPLKHKCWEVEVIKIDSLLLFEVDINVRQDHAGANLEIGFAGHQIRFTFYDDRHWDYDKNCWENYD